MVASSYTTSRKVTAPPPTLFDLVGEGTAFAENADFADPAKLPLLQSYAKLAGYSTQDMANLLDKTLDAKNFLNSPVEMKIDDELVALNHPVSGNKLRWKDAVIARSGPEFSVPMEVEAVHMMLQPRPDEQQQKIEANTKGVKQEASAQGLKIPEEAFKALPKLLQNPSDFQRPMNDYDFQVVGHNLLRDALKETLNARMEKPVSKALANGIMRAHLQECGQIKMENVIAAQAAGNKVHYTEFLHAQLQKDPTDTYHPVKGEILRHYGTGVEHRAAEWRVVKDENGNEKIMSTTEVFATYPEKEAKNILGDTCYRQEGIVEKYDAILTNHAGYEGVLDTYQQDKQYKHHLLKAQAINYLSGISPSDIAADFAEQKGSQLDIHRVARELQKRVDPGSKAYDFLGGFAAVYKEERIFIKQKAHCEEIGAKLALCEQQKRDLAEAQQRLAEAKTQEEAEKHQRACDKALGKLAANMEVEPFVRELQKRKEAGDPEAAALWSVMQNALLQRLPQWGVDTPEALQQIGGLENIVTAEAYSKSLSKPGRSLYLKEEPSTHIRAALGMGEITPEVAAERIARFSSCTEGLYNEVKEQKTYIQKVAALHQRYEILQGNSDDFVTRVRYMHEFVEMKNTIEELLATQPELMQRVETYVGKNRETDIALAMTSNVLNGLDLFQRQEHNRAIAAEQEALRASNDNLPAESHTPAPHAVLPRVAGGEKLRRQAIEVDAEATAKKAAEAAAEVIHLLGDANETAHGREDTTTLEGLVSRIRTAGAEMDEHTDKSGAVTASPTGGSRIAVVGYSGRG